MFYNFYNVCFSSNPRNEHDGDGERKGEKDELKNKKKA